jgi:hypothetical protein
MGDQHCARGACGYLIEFHDLAGRCPGVKAGKFQRPDPVDRALWREIMARDLAARHRELERANAPYVPKIVLPPIVPARPPLSPGEFAGWQGKQAVGLGRRAAGSGFDLMPLYWLAGDETEGCAVKGQHAAFCFVATWKRAAGRRGSASGWGADIAYAWHPGDRQIPARMTHTDLERLFRG